MRALVGLLFLAALAGPAAACPPSDLIEPPSPHVGWAPVATVRKAPPPRPPEGASLLVFGVIVSSVMSSLVLIEKLRLRRTHTATSIDPLPSARIVRR